MITDTEIREQGYVYFLAEAPELIQTIERELFSLAEEYSITKVHNLMRATHTIKGGAATVGLECIQAIAHSLEDVFKALYSQNVIIDSELQTLILEAYECLYFALNAELKGGNLNEEEVLCRATSVFTKLKAKLGDAFGDDSHIPTSEELGFDIVQSIFEVGVKQRLDNIVEAINNIVDDTELTTFLNSQAEVFLGLAESLNLPGFATTSQTIITALQVNPTQIRQIATIAITDLQQAHTQILAGDRTHGGAPSEALKQLAIGTIDDIPKTFLQNQDEFYRFLTTSGNTQHECIKSSTAKLYLKIVHYIFGWFNHEVKIPESALEWNLLISHHELENTVSYLESWLSRFLEFIREDKDSPSLCLYRQGIILITLLAVAKFQWAVKKSATSLSIIKVLQQKIAVLAKAYQQYPPVTAQEKNWTDNPKLQKLLNFQDISTSSSTFNDNLLEVIWGGESEQNLDPVEPPTEHENCVDSQTSLAISEPANTDIATTANDVVNEQIIDKVKTYQGKKNQTNSSVRVDVECLQTINYLASELLIHQKRRTLNDEQIQDILWQLLQRINKHQETLNQLRDLPLQIQNLTTQHTQKFASVNFDPLEMDGYTDFHLILHESIEETLQLQETTESIDFLLKQATQISHQKQKLAFNLIDNLVSARMSPLANIINHFPQMMKNLSSVYHKSVELKVYGTDILVDKAIAEKLHDPLLHLVRNAFDHGIEPPQIRQELGKPEQGLIEIHAYHQGSQTIIEVRDDGQGIKLETIRQKAIAMNLISANNEAKDYISSATESALLEIMFAPGFSTTARANEISGRGMGLDIVRSRLQVLNGSVSVQTLPNQGTKFILKIPFSMTTDKLMLIQSGGVIYALLLDSVEKILIPSSPQIKEFEGKRVLHWDTGDDDTMVSLYQMSELMNYHGTFFTHLNNGNILPEHHTEMMNQPVLMLKRHHSTFAVQVEQIIGEQELVIRPLGSAIAPPKYVYGCSSLANGNLILVIDGALLLESVEMQATLDISPLLIDDPLNHQALPISESVVQSTPILSASNSAKTTADTSHRYLEPHHKLSQVVLVVDDAISLRQTLSLTLQKAGYQVIQAQNGIEALEQLQRHPEIQLVVSDLEMPRMNGFELLSHLQQHPNYIKIPLIILTSRSAEKHRQLAQELGAKAYLTKPYLEHELITTIEHLINVSSTTFFDLSPSPSPTRRGEPRASQINEKSSF
ncbi:hybrid sensor histidine kinase/response regulator [Nostoc sp. TCL26-01]|uniref:hybrid sensor histidine kinase/response regulator n=1 Tax=Nostoc sp. TCL26-01 TaxID=2576904 RepID=UPI0015B8D7DF|nr:hybrid sensor histidine kinase/response regulator [Nostoc sp. TCL26-01]QLE55751.1 hybrid sensor histidine kinase/response regulator [Nostoc sp. TCL26-01]